MVWSWFLAFTSYQGNSPRKVMGNLPRSEEAEYVVFDFAEIFGGYFISACNHNVGRGGQSKFFPSHQLYLVRKFSACICKEALSSCGFSPGVIFLFGTLCRKVCVIGCRAQLEILVPGATSMSGMY